MTRIALAVAITAAAAFAPPLRLARQTPPASSAQQAGPAQTPKGFVLGRVLDAVTNRPIPDALVTLGATTGGRGVSHPAESVLTTSNGYFFFREVGAGAYPLTVQAPGYLPGGYGQRRPRGVAAPLALAEGERPADLTLRLWREATVSGMVRDEQGDPVSGIGVTLIDRVQIEPATRTSSVLPVRLARTDADGAYQFVGLLPGEYLVSIASRVNQFPASIGDADAAALDRIRNSGVSSLSSGLRSLGPTVRLGDQLIQTTGEGNWGGSNALAGVLPMTMGGDGAVSGYPTLFFPSALSPAQATPIRLSAGDDRRGVDFLLKPVTLRRVAGRLEGPAGPLSGFAVHLLPVYAADSNLERTHETGVTITGPDGAFAFVAVPPGDYVIKAWRLQQSLVIGTDPLPAESTLWATQRLTVAGQSLTNVVVSAKTGSTIRGRIVLDGTATPLQPQRFQTILSVAFEPPWPLAFGARLSVRVGASLDFATQGLPPGTYVPLLPNQFNASATGWYFESAMRGGRDLLVEPLLLEPATDATDVVITFADRRTTLTGSVVDAAGRPEAAAAVVLFPAAVGPWIDHGLPAIASTSIPASQGIFTVDIRPGDYFIAAIDEARLEDWRKEPTVRALATQATRVTIARGENSRPGLRLIPIRVP
ncbi:MAG TPA: carboxypeptidase-like regulatory domain-containing protein [Vicinamibacterales bacterium]|nr:carboxypeptidase-like regulatory domain-containing protein [Vicinamibacterales bacterium]